MIYNSDIPLYYLKYPTTPTFNSADGSGTELEWKDNDKIKIAERILRDIGIRVNEKQLFEYAQQLMMES
jgi:hypothetical protein